ncbi:MAG: hypothetical protein JWN44_881 [Myxococcales bacterium]|nr:hypothetical protein [Myxococcales bacterium]
MSSGPRSMLCIYKLNPGAEEKFRPLIKAHWPTLNAVGLAGPEPVKIWRGENKKGDITYIETFQWKDADAPRIAHQTPEVMKVWEPMGPLLAGMDFLEIEPATL